MSLRERFVGPYNTLEALLSLRDGLNDIATSAYELVDYPVNEVGGRADHIGLVADAVIDELDSVINSINEED